MHITSKTQAMVLTTLILISYWFASSKPDGLQHQNPSFHFVAIRKGGWLLPPIFSPDSKYLASRPENEQNQVRLWDVNSTKLFRTLKYTSQVVPADKENVSSIDFSPDSQICALGCNDGIIRLFSRQTGQLQHKLVHTYPVKLIQYAPNGKTLAAIYYESPTSQTKVHTNLVLWDTATWREIYTVSQVDTFVFSHDSSHMYICSEDKQLGVLDIKTGQMLKTISTNDGDIQSIALSHDDKRLAMISSGYMDRMSPKVTFNLMVWSLPDLNNLFLRSWQNEIGDTRVSFSPVEDIVATTFLKDSRNEYIGQILLWDAKTGKLLRTISCGQAGVDFGGPVFSPDGRLLACVSNGPGDITIGWLKVWNANTGKLIKTLEYTRYQEEAPNKEGIGAPESIAFSPDNKWLVSISSDDLIRFWHISH